MSGHSGQESESDGLYRGQATMSDSYGYPFATLAPSQVGAASRRQSMTVQHMLNPSDEEPRRPSQSHYSQSSDNDSDRPGPSSNRNSNVFRSESQFLSVNQSRRSGRGPARANRRANRQVDRRANRRQSLSSSASEARENDRRAFRKAYTEEEGHFIW